MRAPIAGPDFSFGLKLFLHLIHARLQIYECFGIYLLSNMNLVFSLFDQLYF